MAELSYLELITGADGHARFTNGVVRSDEVDTLSQERQLRGRGLRVYRAAKRDAEGRTPLSSFAQLWESIPRVLADIIEVSLKVPMPILTVTSKEVGEIVVRTCFASMDLERHRIQVLDIPKTPQGIDELVAAWSRTHGAEQLLLEIESSRASIETLLKDIQGAATRLHDINVMVVDDLAPRRNTLPPETKASAERRAQLAADWLDVDGVSALLGSKAENTSQMPNVYRRAGKLLGVWVVGENRYRFPPWQFANGRPIAEMQELLSLLRGPQGVARGAKTSGWEEIEWLTAPHAWLEGKTPAELLASDAPRVLEVAIRDFSEDADAGW